LNKDLDAMNLLLETLDGGDDDDEEEFSLTDLDTLMNLHGMGGSPSEKPKEKEKEKEEEEEEEDLIAL
jgi:hypothetical protein